MNDRVLKFFIVFSIGLFIMGALGVAIGVGRYLSVKEVLACGFGATWCFIAGLDATNSLIAKRRCE